MLLPIMHHSFYLCITYYFENIFLEIIIINFMHQNSEYFSFLIAVDEVVSFRM